MSTFYVVATPIGNLEDITLRALKILASVDVILCEDTRMTKRLLDKYDIKTRTLSYHAHSNLSRTSEVISSLKGDDGGLTGKNIALVSDAGTPAISDPGGELVRHIREECREEISSGQIKIESIPGPSAVTSALSIAGVPCADFTFLGFLPHKKGRETLFKEITEGKRTMVFYESPHRILKTLESLVLHLRGDNFLDSKKDARNSNKTAQVTVCREMTKVFEQVVSGTPQFVRDYFRNNSEKVRGEFVVIVSFH